MIFKTPREDREWAELVAGGYMIVPVVQYVAEASIRLMGKQVVVTGIVRTHAEQIALCKELGVPYYDTVHTLKRGVDLRSLIYTGDEIDILLEMTNRQFTYGRGKRCAIFHNVGAGPHFHLQAPSAHGVWKPA
jgi:hypothetical protein